MTIKYLVDVVTTSIINQLLAGKQTGRDLLLSFTESLELASQAALFLDDCRLSNSICGPQELAEQQATSNFRQFFDLQELADEQTTSIFRQL